MAYHHRAALNKIELRTWTAKLQCIFKWMKYVFLIESSQTTTVLTISVQANEWTYFGIVLYENFKGYGSV